MRIARKTAAAAVALALLVLVAGCGRGSAGTGVASLTGSEATSTTVKGAGDKAARDEAFLAFARCMREHGVDMPDPDTSGGDGGIVRMAPGAHVPSDAPEFEAAEAACRHHLQDAMPQDLSPEDRQRMQDAALAFARCMREHGVDVPDPTFGEGGMVQQVVGPVNPEDPAFQRAEEACRELLPRGRTGEADVAVSKEGPE